MAKAVVTLYGDDASVYGSLVLTQVHIRTHCSTSRVTAIITVWTHNLLRYALGILSCRRTKMPRP